MMKNLASGRISPLQNATFAILNGFALAKREGSEESFLWTRFQTGCPTVSAMI